jgi:hypothetical protein
MTRLRLDFVQSFIDRHGRVRHYFRRRGFKRVPLPGLPGSEQFMAAYQAAVAGVTAEPVKIGATRTKPGTVNATIVGFYQSSAFMNLRPVTQSSYRGVLEAFRAKHGEKRIEMLERRHVRDLIAEKAGRPGAQRNLLRMLKMLLNFAVEMDIRPDNPAAGVKLALSKGDGFTHGARTRLPALRNTTQSEAGHGWRSPCFCTRRSVGLTWSEWGVSTFATALCT